MKYLTSLFSFIASLASASTLYVGTLTQVSGPTAPVLTDIAASFVNQTNATIVWTSDQPCDSTVDYGVTTGYGSTTNLATLLTSHSIGLSNLTAATVYNFRVSGTSSNGTGVSGNSQFTTQPIYYPIKMTTNNLVVDLDFSQGLTMDPSGNYITNVIDQSGNGNNAYQTDTNLAFLKWTNSAGLPCARVNGSHMMSISKYMSIGTNLSLNSQAVTVYAMCNGPRERESANIISFGNGWESIPFLGFSEFNTYSSPVSMVGPLWSANNVIPAINMAVFCAWNSTTNTGLRWNNTEQTTTARGSATLKGAQIGRNTGGYQWGGDLVRLRVYNVVHTPAERQANIDAAATYYNIVTNFNTRVVCRGDSTTEGWLVYDGKTWPKDLSESKTNVQVYACGSGSARIQTNGIAAGNNTLFGDDPTFVDPIFALGGPTTNWLFQPVGVNDIDQDLIGGQNTYGRLTNDCAARLAATPAVKIVVGTIANNSTQGAAITNYNAAIRSQYQGYWYGVADKGAGSGQGLDDYTGPNFADGVHPSSAGHAIYASGFLPFLP